MNPNNKETNPNSGKVKTPAEGKFSSRREYINDADIQVRNKDEERDRDLLADSDFDEDQYDLDENGERIDKKEQEDRFSQYDL